MSYWQFRSINENLVQELATQVMAGENVGIMGQYYGGKTYVLRSLHRALRHHAETPVLIEFFTDTPCMSDTAVIHRITNAVRQAYSRVSSDPDGTNALLWAVNKANESVGRAIPLLLASANGMAYHLERRLVEELHGLIEGEKAVVVITGEEDLLELIDGPRALLKCDQMYMLQGYERDELQSLFVEQASRLRLSFRSGTDAFNCFWESIGNNASHLLRLMWRLHIRHPNSGESPLDLEALLDVIRDEAGRGVHGTLGLARSTQVIAVDSSCWTKIEALRNDGVTDLDYSTSRPGALEFAGVAVRTGTQLRSASAFCESFLRSFYDDRRLGDLYARNGDWEEAFKRYSRLSSDVIMRPTDFTDRSAAAVSINSLCAHLYTAVALGIETVRSVFVKGCLYVLGFPEVSFWTREEPDVWQYQPLASSPASSEVLADIRGTLPTGCDPRLGDITIPVPYDSFVVGKVISGVRGDRKLAVVISDFHGRVAISRERLLLLRELLVHFERSHDHALAIARSQSRAEVLTSLASITVDVFAELAHWRPLTEVLSRAADGLLDLGYRRVNFWLVDPEEKCIQRFCDKHTPELPDMTDPNVWPLESTKDNFVLSAVRSGRYLSFREGFTDFNQIERTLIAASELGSFGVLPFLVESGEAIGAAVMERSDRSCLSVQEVDDLMFFLRRLATAIAAGGRVSLMDGALNRIPEPVLILDGMASVRYANKPAADLFEIRSGWREDGSDEKLPAQGTGSINEQVRDALAGRRRVRHEKKLGSREDFTGEVLCERIEGWHHHTSGALIAIHELNYLQKVFDAFSVIAEAKDRDSAMTAVLEAAKILGHKWGRLYIIEEGQPDRLIAKLCFHPEPEVEANFTPASVLLPLRSKTGTESWLSILNKRPYVYCYRPDLEDGTIQETDQGLEYITVRDPMCKGVLHKQPFEFWLDFPLISADHALGKLTVQCDKDLKPEQFEFLRLLADMSSRIWRAILVRERLLEMREDLVRTDAVDQLLGIVAHNFRSQMAGLSPLLQRYVDREVSYPLLKEINSEFKTMIDDLSKVSEWIRQVFKPLRLEPAYFDIVASLRGLLANCGCLHTFHCVDDRVEVCADQTKLRMALAELIKNSHDAIRDAPSKSGDLQLDLLLESFFAGGREMLRLIFRDNGPGIPAPLKSKVFNHFYSYHRSGEKGTGIGLTLVQRIIRLHAGRIYEAGGTGKGVEFVIEFPRFVKPDHPGWDDDW